MTCQMEMACQTAMSPPLMPIPVPATFLHPTSSQTQSPPTTPAVTGAQSTMSSPSSSPSSTSSRTLPASSVLPPPSPTGLGGIACIKEELYYSEDNESPIHIVNRKFLDSDGKREPSKRPEKVAYCRSCDNGQVTVEPVKVDGEKYFNFHSMEAHIEGRHANQLATMTVNSSHCDLMQTGHVQAGSQFSLYTAEYQLLKLSFACEHQLMVHLAFQSFPDPACT